MGETAWNEKIKMKSKIKYCYVVFCNPEPIIYGIYSNKKAARNYAQILIDYRQKRAKERNYEFDYYHYLEEDKRKENDFEVNKEKLIFSTCLKIKDNLKEFSEDGCWVKVVRYVIK